ncbi:MAG: hypothetical protein VKK59_02675 [Vampirovibrionales bacterium]|nr:hypothetical protein [Vampirovibrionales bacterium]
MTPLPERSVDVLVPSEGSSSTQMHCPCCHGRYFKTLEMRYVIGTGGADTLPVILSKKRCKRCKSKTIFEKSAQGVQVCSFLAQWQQAKLFLEHRRGPVFLEHRIFVSQYSAKISQDVSHTLGYLKQVAAIQRPFYLNPKS